MIKQVFLTIIFLMPFAFHAQITDKPAPYVKENISDQRNFEGDTTRFSKESTSNAKFKNLGAVISDYKIISHKNDTTYVDTTLTIQKEYKYNYLRKDNFNLMQFSNIGQTYNTLSKDFMSTSLMPSFGARAKHFNYMEIEDVNYYHVPTPLTELMYKTAFEQGQLLDAFFTVNTSKQFNFSMAYKGLRSLGKYQNILTSTGNFRFTTNFKSKNDKYNMRGHVVMQDVFNQENGGLNKEELEFFESGNEEYIDRSIFDMNFQNAENTFRGKRFHLDHSYALIKQDDSIAKNELRLQNILTVEDKYYQFEQSSQNNIFGDAFQNSNLFDKANFDEFNALIGATYNNNIIGELGLAINYTNFNYGYNKVVVLNQSNITNRLKGDVIGLKARYNKSFKKFDLQGEIGSNISGEFTGNYLLANLNYVLDDLNSIQFQINSNSRAPDYNFLLYQSDYINYNWQNDFNNVQTNQFSASIKSQKLLDLSVDFTTIDNYTYFQGESVDGLVKPFQNNKTITYLRVKAGKELKFKNFALDNTVLYQNVKDDNQSFNVPEIVTRNTFYYANHLFRKALYLQTGVIFNYFSKYKMNAYDPVLSEFYTQNNTKLGNFPRLDFFINAKIRQTRIFLKAEHFNSAMTGYNYFSAPNYPYRDFIVRFGLVWNFFL